MQEVKPAEKLERVEADKFAAFHSHINKTKQLNLTDLDGKVFPYRYGSYMIYEANNRTKQFKVVTFINTTSQDAVGLWP